MSEVREKETTALKCEGLTRRFGGLTAVDTIWMDVKVGDRRAIIGPNGAGKTTFFRLISGELPVTAGRIYLFGREITKVACHRRTRLGLGRTFQVTNLFPNLTVLDNILLAVMALTRTKYSMLRPLRNRGEFFDKAESVLAMVGMLEKRRQMVSNLSHGEHRQIEIAMALASSPSLLLLDEPMAGLSMGESNQMTDLILKLKRDITIMLIEHDMQAAFRIADHICVLHQGALFCMGAPEDVRANEDVQRLYFGEE
jgi:branched-chain amino acid transport system ATP-binding protein